ncbi:hypothetical protein HDU67_006621 [Dinochytrium kinnereticum]|nr:hypothetical protein HDU67_006621 [Dinochytrium kinnereticum]
MRRDLSTSPASNAGDVQSPHASAGAAVAAEMHVSTATMGGTTQMENDEFLRMASSVERDVCLQLDLEGIASLIRKDETLVAAGSASNALEEGGVESVRMDRMSNSEEGLLDAGANPVAELLQGTADVLGDRCYQYLLNAIGNSLEGASMPALHAGNPSAVVCEGSLSETPLPFTTQNPSDLGCLGLLNAPMPLGLSLSSDIYRDLLSNPLNVEAKPKRRFYLNDYVAVRGVDGREYYGQIQSFFSYATATGLEMGEEESGHVVNENLLEQEDDESSDDRYFCMRWLIPDRVRFEQAFREGRDFLPSDFSNVATAHVTAESLSSINRVFYSPKLVEAAMTPSIPPQPLSTLSKPMSPQNVLTTPIRSQSQPNGEMRMLWALTLNPNVKLQDLISMVALQQASHVQLFETIYSEGFLKWLAWMLETDRNKFLRYANNLARMELRATINSSASLPQSSSVSMRTRLHILDLVVNHFLLPTELPFRVAMLMKAAVGLVSFLRPENFGWCRLPTTPDDAALYPFSLRRLVRLAHVIPSEMVALNNSNPPSEQESIRLLHHLDSLLETIPADPILAFAQSSSSEVDLLSNPPGSATIRPRSSLISPSFWPVVFAPRPPVATGWSPDHHLHGPIYRAVELLTAGVIHSLMVDYVTTIIKQACDRTNMGVAPAAQAEVINKQLVYRYVETKVCEEIRRRPPFE